MENTNKTKEVLKYMQENEGITSMEAFKKFGATRLSAIIFNLRKRGYDIVTLDMECVDRYGHTVNYAKYVLKEK